MSKNAQGQDNRLEPAYVDTDKMPWGKYKDECLQDVPAGYLAWCWNDHLKEFKGGTPHIQVMGKIMLSNYIWNSRNAINQELGQNEIL